VATLEGMANDIGHIKETVERLEGTIEKQNGRQRENSDAILLMGATLAAALVAVKANTDSVKVNEEAIHDAEIKSVKGDRLVAVITAFFTTGGAAALLVFGQ